MEAIEAAEIPIGVKELLLSVWGVRVLEKWMERKKEMEAKWGHVTIAGNRAGKA